MRLLMLTPALAFCLVACGKGDDSEAQNAGRALTAEAISSNDVTAIDAVPRPFTVAWQSDDD